MGLRIPYKVAQQAGITENSLVELTISGEALTIKKKRDVPTIQELIASIPDDFQYPDDIVSFIESEPLGRELL